ncbi:MAG: hypothetical protein ACOYME_12970 [Prochlorotrichaceae cyanobacterium]
MSKIIGKIDRLDHANRLKFENLKIWKFYQALQEFGYSMYRKSQYHDRVITYG